MAGRKHAPRTGELSRRRLNAARTPEARFTAMTEMIRTRAARLSRKRDESGRAQAIELLDEATARLEPLTSGMVTHGDR